MAKVLLTGGSGFIAAHCLGQLLDGGYSVVTTVRSEEKAQRLRQAHKDSSDRLEVAIVPDISVEGAFDEVVKTPGLEYVLHTASPFHFNFTDPQTELIDPALIGTTGILKAIKKSAPSVRRVVVTSSFAAVMSEAEEKNPNHTLSEESWNPVTLADIHKAKPTAYRASKKLAEKAAWDFVANEKPNFDLVTVNPPLVYGPVEHHLAALENINTSNAQLVNFLQGKYKTEYPPVPGLNLSVDVRDVAKAHVQGIANKSLGGKRLLVTQGRYDFKTIVKIVKDKFPEFADRLPGDDVKGGVQEGETFKVDTHKTNDLLGFKYITLEQSVIDTVASLKEHGI